MMRNDEPGKLVLFTLIAGRKQKDALSAALSKAGLKVVNVIYGKGTVKASYLKNVLGLVPEENKVVITGLLSREKSDAVFAMLVEKFDFNKPNTGIAYMTSIDKLSF